MWILCLTEDSLDTSSLIFSEKQSKNIYECRLLQSVDDYVGFCKQWQLDQAALWKNLIACRTLIVSQKGEGRGVSDNTLYMISYP